MLNIIGLMSGTSADGIDATLIQSDGEMIRRTGLSHFHPYPSPLKRAIHAAAPLPDSTPPHADHPALTKAITDAHIQTVQTLLTKVSTHPDLIGLPQLIGLHGQTLYHNPATRQTIQLGDGTRLAQATRLPVIYDFRRADIEAGGQGAPLIPIYHRMLLMQSGYPPPAAFINIGGVANLSYYESHDRLTGYDIGPGNALIDDLVLRHFDLPYDKGGQIAAQAHPHPPFIAHVLGDPFFQIRGAKSLDRTHFHSYLDHPTLTAHAPADQVATVTALTAGAILHALKTLPLPPDPIIFAGGGIHNQTLMAQIRTQIKTAFPASKLLTAEQIGADSDMLEAEMIAFLAARYHYNLASTFADTTGVPTPQICGRLALP